MFIGVLLFLGSLVINFIYYFSINIESEKEKELIEQNNKTNKKKAGK